MNRAAADLHRRCRYGAERPRWGETILVPTGAIEQAIAEDFFVPRRYSGSVQEIVNGERWAERTIPLRENPKIQRCLMHWVDGIPWERTGIYALTLNRIAERGVYDGYRCLDELVLRYRRLDAHYDTVRSEGRLRRQAELGSTEIANGILIHVGPKGEPIFGRGGCHRIGIALALGLPVVPAVLGCVHPDGVIHVKDFRPQPAPSVDMRLPHQVRSGP